MTTFRVPEGTTVTFTDRSGNQRELVAKGEQITAEDAHDEKVLAGFGFEVADEAKVSRGRRGATQEPSTDAGEEG